MPYDRRQLFTFANGISVGRLLLLVPLFVFLRQGEEGDGNRWAMVLMAIALVSDMLDGLLARWLHQVSDWGKLLDPLADKIWIGSLAVFLALPWREHPLPWPFVVLLLGRDLAIVALGCLVYRRKRIVMASTWLGKITMTASALTLIFYTVNWTPSFAPWLRPENLLWVTTVLLIASSLSYARRFYAVMSEVPSPRMPSASTSLNAHS